MPPALQETGKYVKNHKSKNYFRFLFSAGRCIGLPLFNPRVVQAETETKMFIAFCYLMTFFKISSYLFSSITIYNILQPTTLRLTFYTFNGCSTIIVIVIVANRARIRKAIKTITQLSMELRHNCSIGSRHSISLTIILIILISIIFFAQIAFFFDYTKQDSRWTVIKIFGVILNNSTRRVYLDAYHCSIVFTYTNSTVTVCLMSLVSYNISKVLKDILHSYSRKLKLLLQHPNPNAGEIFENITLFRRIVFCVREVERSLSVCSLFLYGASITWLFNSFNVIIVKDSTYHTPLAYSFVGITTSLALVVFMAMTNSAARVIAEDEALKRLAVRLAEKPFHVDGFSSFRVCHFSMLHYLNLMRKVIRENKICLTAGDMFAIRKSLILTVAGVLFSYGVLLHQFGDQQL